jgi:uncharacterized membrane protein
MRQTSYGVYKNVKWQWNKKKSIIGIVGLLIFIPAIPSFVYAQTSILSESITLFVFFDGYVQVSNILDINQTYPQVIVDLFTLEPQNLIFVDENESLLDYSILNNQATVFSLGANQIKTSYFTSDLTSKTGKYWTLSLNTTSVTSIVMPQNTSIISLNKVPEQIESFNNQITIEMSSGEIEISYVASHIFEDQPSDFELLPLIFIFSIIGATIFSVAYKLTKYKKPEKSKVIQKILDSDKLFNQHKHLRPEEIQVINFLGKNNLKAYEAQIYEELNLPRTTTWRLLKRLQGLEIINIEKSRRQNIVTIRRKYLKK